MTTEKRSKEAIRESEFIGSVVRFAGAIEKVPPQLEPGDFINKNLGQCWSAIKSRHLRGRIIDAVSVYEDVSEDAAEALGDAVSLSTTSSYVEHYAREIIEESARRTLASALSGISSSSLEELVADVSGAISAATERCGFSSDESAFSYAEDRMKALLDLADMSYRGVKRGRSIGLSALDRFTGGIRPGTTWIVGASPSAGKSTMLMQMASAVADGGGKSVFVSAEMPINEIALREGATATGINSLKISNGPLTEQEIQRIAEAANKMVAKQGDGLAVSDSLGTDAEQILSTIKRMRRQGKLDVVFIDYIQKLHARRLVSRGSSRTIELETIANMFADFARETGASVVIASQLRRVTGEPGMDALRDSGGLEAAADVILLLHREDVEAKERKIILAKNRQGPCGTSHVYLDPARMMFYPLVDDGGRS